MVRKRLEKKTSPEQNIAGKEGRLSSRNVLVARHIRPGETIRLNSGRQTATMPPLSPLNAHGKAFKSVPESLVRSSVNKTGVKHDGEGRLVEYSVLGDPEEYLEMKGHVDGGDESRSNSREDDEYSGKEIQVLETNPSSSSQDYKHESKDNSRSQSSIEDKDDRLDRARRLEEKRRKKELREMLVGDRIRATKDERCLQRWEQQSSSWHRMSMSLSKKTGRNPADMVFNRVDNYRAEVEKQDIICKATPEYEKGGEVSWEQNLRSDGAGGGTVYVTLGGPTSGLYVPIKQPSQEPLDVIRRPRASSSLSSNSNGSNSSRRSSSGSQKGLSKKLRKRIEEIRPTDPNQLEDLIIVGTDLFAPEEEERKTSLSIDVDADEDILSSSMEVDSLEGANGETDVCEEDERLAEAVLKGPEFAISRKHISLTCTPNGTASGSFLLSNTGSTVLFYRLKHVQDELSKGHSCGSEVFWCAKPRGTLLPGQEVSVVYTFAPDSSNSSSSLPSSGLYLSRYAIETTPNTEVSESDSIITIRGVVSVQDTGSVDRSKIEEQLAAYTRPALSVESVIGGIHTDEIEIPSDKEELSRLFYRKNRDLKLFYYEDVFEALQCLATDVISLQKRSVRSRLTWDLSVSNLLHLMDDIPKRYHRFLPKLKDQWMFLAQKAAVRPAFDPVSCIVLSEKLASAQQRIDRISEDFWRHQEEPTATPEKDSTAETEDKDENDSAEEPVVPVRDPKAKAELRKQLLVSARESVERLVSDWLDVITNTDQKEVEAARILKQKKEEEEAAVAVAASSSSKDKKDHTVVEEPPSTKTGFWGYGNGGVISEMNALPSEDIQFVFPHPSGAILATSDNAVFQIGVDSNVDGKDGDGSDASSTSINLDAKYLQQVYGSRVISTATSGTRSVFVLENGSVLNLSSEGECTAVDVSACDQRIVQVAVCQSSNVTVLLGEQGAVYTYGSNEGKKSLLGHGDEADRETPTQIESFKETAAVQVACGASFCAILSKEGKVWYWGEISTEKKGKTVPTEVDSFATEEDIVKQLITADNSFFCVTEKGAVYSWGANPSSILGHGDAKDQKAPKEIEALSEKRVVSLSIGAGHVVCLSASGEAFAWGDCSAGQMGPPAKEEVEEEDNKKKKAKKGASKKGKAPTCIAAPQAVVFEGVEFESVTASGKGAFARFRNVEIQQTAPEEGSEEVIPDAETA